MRSQARTRSKFVNKLLDIAKLELKNILLIPFSHGATTNSTYSNSELKLKPEMFSRNFIRPKLKTMNTKHSLEHETTCWLNFVFICLQNKITTLQLHFFQSKICYAHLNQKSLSICWPPFLLNCFVHEAAKQYFFVDIDGIHVRRFPGERPTK